MNAQTELKIVLRNIDDLICAEYNPRKLSDDQFEQIKSSIQRFGLVDPIIVNVHPDRKDIIVGGHQRVKVAKSLGYTEIPCVEVVLTPERERELNIRLNKATGEWDWDLLKQHFNEEELSGYGFSTDELNFTFDETVTDGLTDPEDVPEPPDEAITKPGDIWILGDHRLMCGDSSSPADLDKLLAGVVIDLVNMDPPYNVKVEPRSNNACAAGLSDGFGSNQNHHQQMDEAIHGKRKATHTKLRPKDRPLKNDFVPPDEFDKMLAAWFGNASRVLKPGGSFYIWGGYANLGNYPKPLKDAGLYFSQAIVWDKQHPVLTRKDFLGSFELAFYGWKEGAGHQFLGPTNATDLWHVKKVPPQHMVHLTEKPAELAVLAIQYSSRTGENVLDLFGGSGSTLIGCEQTGRHAFLMELDPLYCDVIVQRWANFTGKEAVHIKGAQNGG